MADYSALWEELGLDIARHEHLLASIEALHKRTHLSRPNRPAAMARFDRVFHDVHRERLRQLVEHRKAGGKAIGTMCIFVPDEIALAAGVIPIPLCGGAAWSVPYADSMFPRDICPLIRSTFGMALSKTCPYEKLMDFAVGETTCDAKKKTWDLVGFEVLEVPHRKEPQDRELWRNEVLRFRDMMQDLSGTLITEERLREGVRLMNRKRRALQRINEFRKLPEPPINGLDALLVAQIALGQDVATFVADAEALIADLRERVDSGVSAYTAKGPRVVLAGCPSPLGNSKVHHIVESAGMRAVADESCTGSRYCRDLVDESAAGLDGLLMSIADRYFALDCSCFSPNTERLDNIASLVADFRADGVIQNILQYCHTYNVEAVAVERMLKAKSVPSLTIETDYSPEDEGQIRTRVEAFREMIEARR
jgi:benzoyl-CoA reductase/2-hydroxyglutaryl-CoA dehydratase subunit BcrC/BadD/HgdB